MEDSLNDQMCSVSSMIVLFSVGRDDFLVILLYCIQKNLVKSLT